jgi:hypothetical protein
MIFFMIFILLVLLLVIGYPLVRKRVTGDRVLDDGEDRKVELLRKKESSYAAIRELDFDYNTGKISEEDFNHLNKVYKAEALQAIKELEEGNYDSSEAGDGQIELEIRKRRRTPLVKQGGKITSAGMACLYCGAANKAGARFCFSCGKKIGVKCRHCGAFNIQVAQFCEGCGKPLLKYCPGCGIQTGSGAKFCPQCGTSLTVSEGNKL